MLPSELRRREIRELGYSMNSRRVELLVPHRPPEISLKNIESIAALVCAGVVLPEGSKEVGKVSLGVKDMIAPNDAGGGGAAHHLPDDGILLANGGGGDEERDEEDCEEAIHASGELRFGNTSRHSVLLDEFIVEGCVRGTAHMQH